MLITITDAEFIAVIKHTADLVGKCMQAVITELEGLNTYDTINQWHVIKNHQRFIELLDEYKKKKINDHIEWHKKMLEGMEKDHWQYEDILRKIERLEGLLNDK